MSSKIGYLTDTDGSRLLPKTLTKCVTDEDGNIPITFEESEIVSGNPHGNAYQATVDGAGNNIAQQFESVNNNLSGLFTNYDKLGESHNNTVSLSIDKTKYKELFLAVEDTTQNNVLYSITIPKALWNVKSFYLYQTNFNVKVTSGITQLISTSLPDDRWNAILYGIY